MDLWRQSKHAQAAHTLKKHDRLVGDCLSCHSELYRRTAKFNPHVAPAWHGVECATCHGDGVVHSALRDKTHITRKAGEATCRSCHTKDADPHFDYGTYLEKIRHW